MDVKRFLWPTDFSENAVQALPVVTSLAQKYQAEIYILYVLKDYPAVGASYGDYDPADIEKMQEWKNKPRIHDWTRYVKNFSMPRRFIYGMSVSANRLPKFSS